MIVEIKLNSLNVRVPTKAFDIDAGYDLYATTNCTLYSSGVVNTGVSISIPKGYVGLLFSRSGMGKSGVRLSNCVGVIDSGYHGEISVLLHNDSNIAKIINPGDKIAQLVILAIPDVQLNIVKTFSTESARGEKGFGSSGT